MITYKLFRRWTTSGGRSHWHELMIHQISPLGVTLEIAVGGQADRELPLKSVAICCCPAEMRLLANLLRSEAEKCEVESERLKSLIPLEGSK